MSSFDRAQDKLRPVKRGEILTTWPYLLWFTFLAGFALRLYRLGVDSLWYDETVSAFLATESIPDLIAHTARDIHPPGYYLLLHVWARLTGHSEFALAFFSLVFGMLLIPLTYRLARCLTGTPMIAAWAALLVAVSPYNIWYSQEVRMYTLGAALGLAAAYCLWRGLTTQSPGYSHHWLGYFLAATPGLYTLYYFAFLLLILNLIFLISNFSTSPRCNQIRPWLLSNSLILLAYLPWLPTLWRQATEPPVPPWRNVANLSLWSVLSESWAVLSLGQSVDSLTLWPILLLILALFILGLFSLHSSTPLPLYTLASSPPRFPAPLLLLYTFGPLLLIYLISFITPLYHVRYLFTYSPPFYIIIAAGLAWLTDRRWPWAAIVATGLLLAASLFSLYRYHFDPRYRADDYRSAVEFIQRRWQPGDAIIVNAGYVYTAFVYYNAWPDLTRQRLVPYPASPATGSPLLLQTGTVDGSSQLGWGDPRSDFYAMSAAETVAALEAMSRLLPVVAAASL
ncbi:MAG: glycosyltransferase family 39 protein [Anaerolineae bacterium]